MVDYTVLNTCALVVEETNVAPDTLFKLVVPEGYTCSLVMGHSTIHLNILLLSVYL